MLKRRFEILLPRTHNDGRPVGDGMFLQTLEELVVRFGGGSYSPTSIHGVWTHDGKRYEDESWRLVVDATKKNERFFEKWKLTLRERFEQIEIYIVSFPVEII